MLAETPVACARIRLDDTESDVLEVASSVKAIDMPPALPASGSMTDNMLPVWF